MSVGSSLHGVALSDFDEDGNLDAVVVDNVASRDSVHVLLGDGTGRFAPPATSLAAGANPQRVVAADFDGDNHVDLAVASYASNEVHVFGGTGAASFTLSGTHGVSAEPVELVAADFTGDGRPDLAVAGRGGDAISVLLNDGSGSFGSATDLAFGGSPYALVAGDFDENGHVDLAASLHIDDIVRFAMGNGSGGFSFGANLAVNDCRELAVDDLDGEVIRCTSPILHETRGVAATAHKLRFG